MEGERKSAVKRPLRTARSLRRVAAAKKQAFCGFDVFRFVVLTRFTKLSD
jgi:hypothetical protein